MLNVEDMATLTRYGRGIMAKAKHHGVSVMEVLPDLIGHVILRADKVELWGEGTGVALKFRAIRTGRTYAMSYDHLTHTVAMKDGNHQGPVIHRFDNGTDRAAVAAVFAVL